MPTRKQDCTRRQTLRSLVSGSLLLPGIVAELLAEDGPRLATPDPLAPKTPHFPAKVQRVIFLLMSGGVSHLDTFDPKPKLMADAGRKVPWQGPQDPGMTTLQDKPEQTLMGPVWKFRPRGECGTPVSDLFPHMAACVDDLCVIRSMRTDNKNHVEATLGIHTGSFTVSRPSMGSWVSYGLGTHNRNLPSYIMITPELPRGGKLLLEADFLPAIHQGTLVTPGDDPIPNLKRRQPSAELQELQLGLLEAFNRKHLSTRGADLELAARIKSFETAFGMQHEAREAFDVSDESQATLKLYGLEPGGTKGFAWQCLVGRRLAERGVRFIELIDSDAAWDAHGMMSSYEPAARNVDQAIAGLLQDLKQRGLLDETLVVWTSEFGRPPFVDGSEPKYQGRGHQESAFCTWLAGGGVKGGITYGATDDYGINVVENEVHVHDLHATILHLLGLDHTRLTFRHGGRDFRLTDVFGNVAYDILT